MSEFQPTTDEFRWSILRTRLAERKIVEVFQLLRAVEIEPILIKGWDISRYYPEYGMRPFIDIDLSVSPDHFEEAGDIIDSDIAKYINIDLHCGFRHLDTQPWEYLYRFSELVKIAETPVRVLRAEDHLRIICVHWLTDGGEFRDKLWDIYYIVANRPIDFDWDRCLNIVSKNRRRWIVCAIGLAHKFFGLDISGTPIEGEARDLPEWLVRTVEKEWKSDVRLITLGDPGLDYHQFAKQIWKRLPPNPITATIDCEGDFDARTRIVYQIRDIFKRLRPNRFFR